MGLTGKIVRQVEIKSDGDAFYNIFRYRPHHTPDMCPAYIQGVHLLEGDWGTVGSVIIWNYTHDGKEKVSKEIIEAIDEEKKWMVFKVIEGDLTKPYKVFKFILHVDTKGENNLVTWTLDYEKLSEDIGDPNNMMDLLLVMTKDIETHQLHTKKLVIN